MRKAIGCLLLAVMCLLGSLYLPRILQEIQTDQDQQNLISGYVRNQVLIRGTFLEGLTLAIRGSVIWFTSFSYVLLRLNPPGKYL